LIRATDALLKEANELMRDLRPDQDNADIPEEKKLDNLIRIKELLDGFNECEEMQPRYAKKFRKAAV
jgi:hypothetical protein